MHNTMHPLTWKGHFFLLTVITNLKLWKIITPSMLKRIGFKPRFDLEPCHNIIKHTQSTSWGYLQKYHSQLVAKLVE
jgi:hypothetical protein